jgi:pyridoxal phosphate enzyme (YggS family)
MTIADTILALRQSLATTATQSGRYPADIDLIAVSKTQPPAAIMAAIAAGQRVFGENRVQEAWRKFMPLRPLYPDLRLHLIGPLQTNKAEDAVSLFDVIETLDRPKLAAALAQAIAKLQRTPKLLIEVNIGAEPQKAGVLPDTLPDFLQHCQDNHGLTIDGLMCIPPHGQDPTPYFTQLRQLADRHHLPQRSMGMSADYQTAIRCGATAIRVGTAIFGARQPAV